jgi:hypothetical protein
MEQNGASNGHDAKPQKSPPANGASNSPKKRRKVNHGKLKMPTQVEYPSLKHSLIIERVPAACVYCRRSVSPQLGHSTRGEPGLLRLCVMFGIS